MTNQFSAAFQEMAMAMARRIATSLTLKKFADGCGVSVRC